MKAEEYQEQKLEIAGWPVNVTTYRIEAEWHCKIDNVSPGANIVRTTGATREEAEQKALSRATERLGQTKRHAV